MTANAPVTSGGVKRRLEAQAIVLVSAAHFVAHFHQLVLPVLFPFLKKSLGIDFIQLGLGLTIYSGVSVVAQLPMGYVCDRLGSRRVLIAGLWLGGFAMIALGMAPSFSGLLVAAAFLGLANSVYHPADYAILSARMPPARVGRAFSVHTFCGFVGNAAAPVVMLALAAFAGLRVSLIAAGAMAWLVSLPLLFAGQLDGAATGEPAPEAPAQRQRRASVFTPLIIGLTGFYALLSLSSSGLTNFSVVALKGAFGTPLSVANLALSGYLMATAIGVLAGGLVADRTARHGDVAAGGYALNAVIVLAIGTLALGTVPLVAAMAGAGFLGGLIMPSRDMLVRAAAPAGSVAQTFGVVTTGFNIGGAIGPILFGWIMDRALPHWVFGASVVLMIVTALAALIGDRQIAGLRQPVAASAD